MSRNSKIGIAAIVLIAIIAVGVGAYELSYVPPSSGSPTVSIISPTAGATVPTTFTVTVATSNFNIPTQGHIHVYLDSLQNYQLGNGPTFTFTNVAPGTHTIWAQLQNPDHSPLNPPVETQHITITVAAQAGPTVSIASPAGGATVTGPNVAVTVSSTNFNVPADGSYYVYLDSASNMMVSTGSAVTFNNVAPGTHTIWAQLYNTDGTPVSPAVVSPMKTITVVAPTANPTISITSPADGATIQGPAVTVYVSSTGMPSGGSFFTGSRHCTDSHSLSASGLTTLPLERCLTFLPGSRAKSLSNSSHRLSLQVGKSGLQKRMASLTRIQR